MEKGLERGMTGNREHQVGEEGCGPDEKGEDQDGGEREGFQ